MAKLPTDEQLKLTDSLRDFLQSINDLGTALKNCRDRGMTAIDIQNTIMENIPEEDRPAFQQQWPMLSMLLSML